MSQSQLYFALLNITVASFACHTLSCSAKQAYMHTVVTHCGAADRSQTAYNAVQSVAAATPLDGPVMRKYLDLAQANRLWLSLGGFQQYCSTDPKRLQNCHVIVDDTGRIVSTYAKVHLFDVEVFNGPVLKETSFTVPGKEVGHDYTTRMHL